MLKITIPKPCHEDWDKMTPNEHGRHCAACAKTVTDFTLMSDEEVKHFFFNKKEEKTCGRFRSEQLNRIVITLPQNIFYIRIAKWKKFLAACLLAFSTTLFSCETKITQGEPLPYVDTTTIAKQKKDSANDARGWVGMYITYDSISDPAMPSCTQTKTDSSSEYISGDIQIMPIENRDTIFPEQPVEDRILNTKSSDSLKTKNPPKADSIICDNENGITL
jgi:hypothetical protein